MGKKKSGKKKKGGKKKKNAEPQMTWPEALLAFQINIKEQEIEKVLGEVKNLEDVKERHLERNERLKAEQEQYIELLFKQIREWERQLAGTDPVSKELVIEVMKEKWEVERVEERAVQDLKEQIARAEAEIVAEKGSLTYWTSYKEKGKDDQALQIELLERELTDMSTSFEQMAGHLERTLAQNKEEVATTTDVLIDRQKLLASEKAMARMDKHSRQEVLDNDWLRREAAIHREEAEELMAIVETLENENVAIMNSLFECTVDDLKVSRNFYLTQFDTENENLETDGILEMDLSTLRITDGNGPDDALSDRLAVIEDEIHAMQDRAIENGDSDVDEVHFDGENGAEDEDEEDPFTNYLYYEDDNFDDFLQLGPLELKLLSVRGHRARIHNAAPLPPEEQAAKKFRPDEWPVTPHMFHQNIPTTCLTAGALPPPTPRK